MQTHLPPTLSTFLLLLLLLFTSPTFFSCTTASKDNHNRNRNRNNAQDLVRSSCIHSRYPALCLRTLSSYAGPANTPLDVARAALTVSLAHARRTSRFLKSLQSPSGPGPLGQNNNNINSPSAKRQRVALSDCVDQMADSVDELKRSLEELQHLRTATFRWQVSNAQTWVSAALTDGDTCLDGFGDGGDNGGGGYGKVRGDVKRRVTDVARVTSNALYMINRVGDGGAGKPKHRSARSGSKKN